MKSDMVRGRAVFVCVAALVGVLFCGGCGGRRNILLTGYWPPSNEMLRGFSVDPTLNGGAWEGGNWRKLGYDVYAYFPTFPAGTDAQPVGVGVMKVDYQRTLADMEMLTAKLKPVAIISFGQGAGPWEIECNAVNLAKWANDYVEPRQPDVVPPDGGMAAESVRRSTLPVDAIADAVNDAGLGVRAWVDHQGDPGRFLCNYLAYYVCKYQAEHSIGDDGCVAAGFIHVGKDVPADKAKAAAEVTLEQTIEFVQSEKKKN